MFARLIPWLVGVSLWLSFAPASSATKPALRFEPAFAGRLFERPLAMLTLEGDGERFVVLEQDGKLWLLESLESREARLLVDISDRVRRRHGEEGLLSAALDPRFRDNGQLFVYYSASKPRRTVLARVDLRGALERGTATRTSLRVLMEFPQPYGNHNGGTVLFGPDGMLYLGVGDGGAGGDPLGHGQNLGTLLGTILRFDVHPGGGLQISVPSDNPFVSTVGARAEIWAYGLRNPWRMSFDRATGQLWVGDVGQSRFEEVNVVERGGNYGWRLKEGNRSFDGPVRTLGLIDPVHQYGREQGQSITGGYVYRGSELPGLGGAYIFGDYASRRIWALGPNHRAGSKRIRLGRAPCSIASFGEDRLGELYILCLEGRILRLKAGSVAR